MNVALYLSWRISLLHSSEKKYLAFWTMELKADMTSSTSLCVRYWLCKPRSYSHAAKWTIQSHPQVWVLKLSQTKGDIKTTGVWGDWYLFCNSPTPFSFTCSLVNFLFSAKEHFASVSTSMKPLCMPNGEYCHQHHIHDSGPSIPSCFDQVTLYK